MKELVKRIRTLDGEISDIGEDKLADMERFYKTLDDLIEEFQDQPNKYKSRRELMKQLNRTAKRLQKEQYRGILEDVSVFDDTMAYMKKWRFKSARKELDEIRDVALLSSERQRLHKKYTADYNALVRRKNDLREKISRMGHLLTYPVMEEELEEYEANLKSYNRAVSRLLDDFISNTPSRDDVDIAIHSCKLSESGFPAPSNMRDAEMLLSFLQEDDAGDLQVRKLLEYAQYSDAKLKHYMSKPQSFLRAVTPNLSWLKAINTMSRRGGLKIGKYESPALVKKKTLACMEVISLISGHTKQDPADASTFLESLQNMIDIGTYQDIVRYHELTKKCMHSELDEIHKGTMGKELEEARNELEETEKILSEIPEPNRI